MQIFINDTPVQCREQITVTELLLEQNIAPVNIAVAMDNTVIPKTQWEQTVVKDGSHILIIKAVQGG